MLCRMKHNGKKPAAAETVLFIPGEMSSVPNDLIAVIRHWHLSMRIPHKMTMDVLTLLEMSYSGPVACGERNASHLILSIFIPGKRMHVMIQLRTHKSAESYVGARSKQIRGSCVVVSA